jgi:hypothetical protein
MYGVSARPDFRDKSGNARRDMESKYAEETDHLASSSCVPSPITYVNPLVPRLEFGYTHRRVSRSAPSKYSPVQASEQKV